MEVAEKIRELAARIPQQMAHIKTEEACKNALIMPFINALGYNVFDPREVTPELVADVGTKKGEKVDYAILRDGKPIILVECKGCDCNLDTAHASQLYRYFSVTDARFGVLTNGVAYRFFSDLDAPNKMDSKPFLEINMLALDDLAVTELQKFSKAQFDVGAILATANELKITKAIKKAFVEELAAPSEDLVRLFISRVYEGRVTPAVKEQYTELTKRALQQFISERVTDRLRSALAGEVQVLAETAISEASVEKGMETTDTEREAFQIVRAIVSEVVEPKRVGIRDQQSYCGVLLDDNNRRPICRLWFNTARKYIGLFDENRAEMRMPVSELTDIFAFAPQLKATVQRYLKPQTAMGQPAVEA
jgi:hypothetical protein